MSFILDALKKSETDRQQQGSAEFAAVPTRSGAPSVPRWLWVVGILLAVNLAVLIGLLLRPNPAPTQTSMPSSASSVNLSPSENSTQTSFAEQVAAAQQSPPEVQASLPAAESAETVQATVEPLVISQNRSAIPVGDIYPSIQEVLASGLIDLPELHVDIHVFSTEPEDRFVFINMSKLREGSQLAEGPVVAEITPDGVVLRHQGQKFLLPRE